MNAAAHGVEGNANAPVLYMALELSNESWKVVFGDGVKRRQVAVPAGELSQMRDAVAEAKERFGLGGSCRVLSCYEAGRDAFWLHRYLPHRDSGEPSAQSPTAVGCGHPIDRGPHRAPARAQAPNRAARHAPRASVDGAGSPGDAAPDGGWTAGCGRRQGARDGRWRVGQASSPRSFA